MKPLYGFAVLLATGLLFCASPAHADGFVSPTVGVNFGDGGNLDKSRVYTLMTNLIIGAPIGGQRGGGIRPYASGGVGLINRDIKFVNGVGDFTDNSGGFDLGAGVMAYFADNVGLRFDYRYFRTFNTTNANVIGLSSGNFTFSRASVGVLFRF